MLTLTLAGIAADSSPAGATNRRWARRTSTETLMLAGAVIGDALILKIGTPEALGVMLALVMAVVGATRPRDTGAPMTRNPT